jgi:thiol-disulfide isomerase/thioredoxin
MNQRRWRGCIGVGLLTLLVLPAAAQAPTVLRGRVVAGTSPALLLLRPPSPVDLRPDTTRIAVAANGEFAAVLPAAGSREAVLQLGRHELPLWLEPADTLTLQLDARHPGQASLQGRAAGISYYRWAQQRQHTDNFYDAPEGRRDARDPATHRRRADAYRRRAGEVLRQSHARHPLPPAHYRHEALALRYEWGRVLLELPYRYEYERPYQGRVVRPLPESYYSFLAELPLPQDSLLAYRPYQLFAGLYPQVALRARRQRLTFAENITRQFALAYDTVAATWPASATRDYVLAQQLHELLRLAPETEAAPRLADFQARATDPAWPVALARTAAMQQPTAPGQLPPAFQLRDESGRSVDLAAFRGRVVYLDFWASWCKPCRQEQPALRTLQQQFAGQPEVVFVGISLDADAAAWRRALDREPAAPAPPVQLIGQPGDGALRQLFERGGVPQYWLLGPDGRILNAHAPRPSNPGVGDAIQAALAAHQARSAGGPEPGVLKDGVKK